MRSLALCGTLLGLVATIWIEYNLVLIRLSPSRRIWIAEPNSAWLWFEVVMVGLVGVALLVGFIWALRAKS